MGMIKQIVFALCVAVSGSAFAQPPADDAAVRAERWAQLQRAIFDDRQVQDGAGVLALEAPARAHDAALVPLTVTTSGNAPVRSLYLVIDNNPGPLAGKFTFGPAADPSALKVRMRVNTYTNIHAVVEDADGNLYSVEQFVKAAGGCSAPAGPNNEESLRNLGQMKVRLMDPFEPGKPIQAQLMIRHPNFNGMQMDQLTRHYTPAHFIKTIEITYGEHDVLRVESDIALSTDPVLSFGFVPHEKGQLKIVVTDSKDNRFEGTFDVPAAQQLTDAS